VPHPDNEHEHFLFLNCINDDIVLAGVDTPELGMPGVLSAPSPARVFGK
jgi:hypothetical protein